MRVSWQQPGSFCSSDISQTGAELAPAQVLATGPSVGFGPRSASWLPRPRIGRLPGRIATPNSSNGPDSDSERAVSPNKNRGIKNSGGSGAERADVYPRRDSYSRRGRRAAVRVPVFWSFQHATRGFSADAGPSAPRSGRAAAGAGHRRGHVRGPASVATVESNKRRSFTPCSPGEFALEETCTCRSSPRSPKR
jgi:hypothetical protein